MPSQLPPDTGCIELGLEEAIAVGLRDNPRLREAAAQAQAARAGADIAFAPFLPEFNTGFQFSGFNAPVIPGGAFVPASLNAGVYAFSLAEAGVQWTLYDFGRTAGSYGQALSRLAHRRTHVRGAHGRLSPSTSPAATSSSSSPRPSWASMSKR